jgi:multidrug resistance efflux pump
MNIKFIAKVFIIMALMLVSAAALFIFTIPMDFYATVSGRIIPADAMSIASPIDGSITMTIKTQEFKKGDILAKLDSSKEQLALKFAQQELRQTEKHLNWEQKALKFTQKELKLQLDEKNLKAKALKVEEQLQVKQLDLYKSVASSLHEHRKLEEKLRAEEARIFKTLFDRKVVARMDFLKIAHQAHVAKIMSKQIKMDADRRLFEHEGDLNQVKFDEELILIQRHLLENTPDQLRNIFTLEYRILELKKTIAELSDNIEKKIIKAPYDGSLLLRQIKTGSFVKKGEILFEVADFSPPFFRAVCGQDHISEINTGERADIALDNFSTLKYGWIEGKVYNIQTSLKDQNTTYIIDMHITGNPIGALKPGLSGKADIVTYHGTIFSYLSDEQRVNNIKTTTGK